MLPKWCQWELCPRKGCRIQLYVKKVCEIMEQAIRIRLYFKHIFILFTKSLESVGRRGGCHYRKPYGVWISKPELCIINIYRIQWYSLLSVYSLHVTQRNSGQAPIKYHNNLQAIQAWGKEGKQITSRLIISNLDLEGGAWEVSLMCLDSSAHHTSWVV